MTSITFTRPRAAGCGAILLIGLALGAAQAAGAATIHACVKPRSGATRIVGASTKCHRGEQKLAWSTIGPKGVAGVPGASGPAGAPGANGTGPAFATGSSVTTLTEAPVLLLTATLPPGDYVFTAPVLARGEASTPTASFVQVQCFVVDKPGISLTTADLTGESVSIEGFGGWESGLALKSAGEYRAETTMSLAGTMESKVTSTIGVACDDPGTTAGVTVRSFFAELIATQVSSITS